MRDRQPGHCGHSDGALPAHAPGHPGPGQRGPGRGRLRSTPEASPPEGWGPRKGGGHRGDAGLFEAQETASVGARREGKGTSEREGESGAPAVRGRCTRWGAEIRGNPADRGEVRPPAPRLLPGGAGGGRNAAAPLPGDRRGDTGVLMTHELSLREKVRSAFHVRFDKTPTPRAPGWGGRPPYKRFFRQNAGARAPPRLARAEVHLRARRDSQAGLRSANRQPPRQEAGASRAHMVPGLVMASPDDAS